MVNLMRVNYIKSSRKLRKYQLLPNKENATNSRIPFNNFNQIKTGLTRIRRPPAIMSINHIKFNVRQLYPTVSEIFLFLWNIFHPEQTDFCDM